ncbi:MAM and LDL-receptor class A domain-containing protein 1-like [Lytechinus pictus]|uniref:MAM and LDL-receptor class A domain-containing protein 1-like n=1 Tax=Lytechinus pictus TaxID=7653 RepID=UPI0030BA14F4
MVVDLQCNGDEGDIRECPMRDIGHTACPHTDEAGVVCSPGVRLTGGVTPREGTVELLYNESWGSICHTNWDIDDANVICRGLGYDRALNAVGSAFYTEGSGEILIDDVSCTGSEESVFDCGHSPIGETTCVHDEDAGVVCSYEDDSEFYRLKGSYLYIDSSEQLSTANITRLQSPIIQIPVAEGALCFRFWYYMFGEDAQSLRVYVNDVEDGVASGEIAFEVSGNHGEQWIMDQFDIVGNDTAPFTVTIEAVTGVGVNGDIAIDDIEVLAGSCPYEPMSCDFEETFICGFIQDEEDNADWRRGKGDVIQDDEKPPYDNTFHDIHGYYMYFDSNETVQGSTARLWTPPYTFPGQHCLTFFHFMHGSEIGSLQIYAIESGGTISGSSPVWARIGPQGFEWIKAATTIVADSNFQVVFETTSGGPTYSNIAIDDVTITKGPCVRSLQDETSTTNTGCRKAIGSRLGVEDGRIPDSDFKASSDNGISEPYMARLNSYATSGGWMPADGEQSSWIEVDFGLRRWLTGALTQGVLQSSEWSTLLSFSYINESNGRSFIAEHECNLPGGKIFRTNFDSNSIVTTLFPKPILSANIRIHVEGSHSNSALRFEILGMQDIDCNDLYVSGHTESGMYTIRPADDDQSLRAYCDMVSDEGGWMIFQRRTNGKTSFSKTWSDYENGFGALTGEHWIGLKILTRILAQRPYELRIELEYANGTMYVADYPGFSVSNRSTGYRLNIDELEGSSDDPLAYHNGKSFVTPDQLPSNEMPSCDGPRPSGGWWYVGQCDGRVNLNGLYPGMTGDVTREMYCEVPNDGSPLIYTQMKIKPIS